MDKPLKRSRVSIKRIVFTRNCYDFQATHQESGDVERVFGSFHKAHQGGLIHNTYRWVNIILMYLSLVKQQYMMIHSGTTVLVWTINLQPPPQPENTLSGRMKRRLVATLEAPSRTLPVPQTPVYLVIDPTQLNILLDHRPTLPGQRLQNL